MNVHPSMIFLGGLVVIILGAEFVIRGASTIAAMLGVRPIIIGLTVVSIGTSLPELVVGLTAVAEGQGGMAVGNIAGTNILNILFILGLSAALRPLPLQRQSIRLEVPLMIVAAIALFFMSIDGKLGWLDGSILLLGAVFYLSYIVRTSMKESARIRKEYAEEYSKEVLVEKVSKKGLNVWLINIVLLAGGMALTIVGADLLVSGAVSIARSLGVSESIIGLTIVAIGTSAPEMATTVVATIKNDRDVAVGNLLGSSISNVLVILGLTCVLSGSAVSVSDDVLWLDLPLAALVAIVCYPVFRSDKMISRKEGIIFVTAYLVYMITLVFIRA